MFRDLFVNMGLKDTKNEWTETWIFLLKLNHSSSLF